VNLGFHIMRSDFLEKPSCAGEVIWETVDGLVTKFPVYGKLYHITDIALHTIGEYLSGDVWVIEGKLFLAVNYDYDTDIYTIRMFY
jgi:predicted choloylglycine hydrolase